MIFFFSGTGNSRYVAQLLAKGLGDETREMNFFKSGDVTPGNERIIWVFPVHSWGIPHFVVDFVRSVRVLSAVDHYMVCTCGDDAGLIEEQWRCLMAERGWRTRSAFSVIMPNTYVLLPGFNVDSPKVVQKKLAAVPSRVDDIVRRIQLGWDGSEVKKGVMPTVKSKVFYPFFEKFMQSSRPFRYNKARCFGCGRCAAHCPVGNILLDVNRRPVWGRNCTMCLSCYHVCPVHAVNYGSRTKNKGQYLCPKKVD